MNNRVVALNEAAAQYDVRVDMLYVAVFRACPGYVPHPRVRCTDPDGARSHDSGCLDDSCRMHRVGAATRWAATAYTWHEQHIHP